VTCQVVLGEQAHIVVCGAAVRNRGAAEGNASALFHHCCHLHAPDEKWALLAISARLTQVP
jgi:hypothetical protein